MAAPTLSTDAATKGYVDDNFYLNTTTLDAVLAPVSNVSLNAQRLTNLATPVDATDATTKGYVDDEIAAIQ